MADNISVDAWFSEVVPAAPLCPNPIIRKDIVMTCRDLCRRSFLWTAQMPAIDVVANQADYQLAASGADLAGVDRAEFDGKKLDPASQTALDHDADAASNYYWRKQNTGRQDRFYVDSDYKIWLIDIPSEDLTGGLVVWAYLMPLKTATEVPLFLYNEFEEIISIGARGRLMMRANMPWSDTTLGAGLLNTYEQMLINAQQKKFKGFQRVKTRDFVRTRYHDF